MNDYKSSLKQLITLALPVIATSFMSMAYNFINILFVGKLGSNAVAAVGTAGFFMNLSWGISALFTVGAGIKVSHAIGARNVFQAKSYVKSGIVAIFVTGICYYLLLLTLRRFLVNLVGLNDPEVEKAAANFLAIIGLSIPFSFHNLFLTNVFIGYGDSRIPFRINTSAFVLNMLLDPLFIFVFHWGIYGAAAGTLIAQATGALLFNQKLRMNDSLKPSGIPFRKDLLRSMAGLGFNTTLQRVSFSFIAIVMARIISNWGPGAIAVQKVGIQIEAISYMTAGGFMSALSSLSGKAYGAKDYYAQWKSFGSGILLATFLGMITSLLLILFPEQLFSVFLDEPNTLAMGKNYLTILGFSQLFMCLELVSMGAFFGWGKTNIPALTSISFTLLRIPMALLFIRFISNSLSSVWWSITISSIAKGIVLVTLFIILFKKFLQKHNPVVI